MVFPQWVPEGDLPRGSTKLGLPLGPQMGSQEGVPQGSSKFVPPRGVPELWSPYQCGVHTRYYGGY